jgi:hypothetical protein
MPLRSTAAGVSLLVCLTVASLVPGALAQSQAPGTRVLLDAHNAYPYEGRFGDRVDRALATGLPVAIEQDLIWRIGPDGRGESVVGHDTDKVADAPTFEQYFFDRLKPVMEKALAEGRRDQWPLVVLNLDLKTNEPVHHAAIWQVLGRHEAWLTTAPRTATADQPAALTVGPMLVLTGSDPGQQVEFHDRLALGQKLRVFGAIAQPEPPGATARERARALAGMTPGMLIATKATNYRRWVNFPWHAVEAGGQANAAGWTAADRARLDALVARAHAQHLWIRFYTLNGHAPGQAEAQGWSKGYNFGSLAAARTRWHAARDAKVDFIATDQYEAFDEAVSTQR